MTYKQKGFPMHGTKSALKHGDGSWGGTDEAPIVEDIIEKKTKARQTPSTPQPPERTEFHTDESYARILAKWKAKHGIE